MTCVVAYKDKDSIYLGADTQGAAGYDKTDRADFKVFETHGILYGFTSSYRMGQILQYHSTKVLSEVRKEDTFKYVVTHLVPMWRDILKNHGYTTIENNEEFGGSWVVVIDGRIFVIERDFQVGESVLPYSSVGCGMDYALGAMSILHGDSSLNGHEKVVTAIETSMKFSCGVGGRVTVLEQSIKKED